MKSGAILVAVWCLAIPYGQAAQTNDVADLHPDLKPIHTLWKDLRATRQTGDWRAQAPEFAPKVRDAMALMDNFTRSHHGKDLSYWLWGYMFRELYEFADELVAGSYDEAENITRQGLQLLAEADAHDPLTPDVTLRIAVEIVAHHAHTWVKINPAACAQLVDETWEQIEGPGHAKVVDIWNHTMPILEVRFLAEAERLPPNVQEAFLQQRGAQLERYLANEALQIKWRAAMLRAWITWLDASSQLDLAVPVVDEWWDKYGESLTVGDYYFSRVWVALFGEGDWEKASETLRRISHLAEAGQISPEDRAYRQLTQVYYERIFAPGYELRRQNRTRVTAWTQKAKE